MIYNNFLKEKLKQNRQVIGTWSVISSPTCHELIASSGLDFFIIDREHGTSSFETIIHSIAMCENRGVSPIVRVPEISLSEIQRALDAGAHGLHIPNISEENQVEKIIQYTKYPPLGDRGFSPFTRAAGYTSKNSKIQMEKANENTFIAIHVEGVEGIKNLDCFLKYPEIDVIFIGLYDLSKSLGLTGDVFHEKVQNFLTETTLKIQKNGKFVGTIASTLDQLEKFLELGINYITYSVDCDVLLQSYSSIVSLFREKKESYAAKY